MPVEEKVRKLIEAHVRGREMNEQRDREKDEHYQLRLVARIVDLEKQLEVLQRARITNVSDVMRENEAANAEIEALRKDYNELIMALAAATQMVSVPRIKAGSQDGWLVEFAWLKKVKTALRSMPDWEDCSIDLEEIEAVALAMLAAKGDRNG
jgi:hypothetical protein